MPSCNISKWKCANDYNYKYYWWLKHVRGMALCVSGFLRISGYLWASLVQLITLIITTHDYNLYVVALFESGAHSSVASRPLFRPCLRPDRTFFLRNADKIWPLRDCGNRNPAASRTAVMCMQLGMLQLQDPFWTITQQHRMNDHRP